MRKQSGIVGRFLEDVDANLPFDEWEREGIVEEIWGHLADSANAMQAAGMDPFDADRAAVARLGPADRLADELTRARRDGPRLLAAAGAGVWGAVRGGAGFPYRLAIGLLVVVVACIVAGALMGPSYLFSGGSYSGSDPSQIPGFNRIGAPAPAAIAKAGSGTAGYGIGYVRLFVDVPDRSLLAGWTDLRVEAWKGTDSAHGGTVDPAETAPFLTATAEWSAAGTSPDGTGSWSGDSGWTPTAATLSGALRLDRSPGVSYAWFAITGVAPDGTRHLLSPPNGSSVVFNGRALDWFEAILAGN
jgi:hypothetical protein